MRAGSQRAHGDAAGPRFFHTHAHGFGSDNRAHSVPAVEVECGWRFIEYFDHRRLGNKTIAYAIAVHPNARDAMRTMSTQIGLYKIVGHNGGVGLWQSGRHEDAPHRLISRCYLQPLIRIGLAHPGVPSVEEARFHFVHALMQHNRLDDLIADGIDWIERGHRFLENHANLVAA